MNSRIIESTLPIVKHVTRLIETGRLPIVDLDGEPIDPGPPDERGFFMPDIVCLPVGRDMYFGGPLPAIPAGLAETLHDPMPRYTLRMKQLLWRQTFRRLVQIARIDSFYRDELDQCPSPRFGHILNLRMSEMRLVLGMFRKMPLSGGPFVYYVNRRLHDMRVIAVQDLLTADAGGGVMH